MDMADPRDKDYETLAKIMPKDLFKEEDEKMKKRRKGHQKQETEDREKHEKKKEKGRSKDNKERKKSSAEKKHRKQREEATEATNQSELLNGKNWVKIPKFSGRKRGQTTEENGRKKDQGGRKKDQGGRQFEGGRGDARDQRQQREGGQDTGQGHLGERGTSRRCEEGQISRTR